MSIRDRLTALLEPLVERLGLVLDAVDVTPAGKRRVIRVTLDRQPLVDEDGWTTAATRPLSLDEVAAASRMVSAALDSSDALGDSPYVLEVSSPGIGGALTRPRHFRRNVGRLLDVITGDASLTGRVVRASEMAVVLAIADADSGSVTEETYAYAALTRAAVGVEFSSAQERN